MSAVGDARKRLAESAALDDFEYTLTRRALQQIKAEARAEGAAEALTSARDDIRERIATFRALNADEQYLNALNDAWGLVANRLRAALRGER